MLANLVTQESASQKEQRCGLFDTGFAGTFYAVDAWRSVFEVGAAANVSTPPRQWPVAYIRGDLASVRG